MTKEGNIAAFTILELCVALVLTGIVSSLGYNGFAFLQGQFHHSQLNRERVMEADRLMAALKLDFFRSDQILDQGGLILFKKEDEDYTYEFLDSIVVRTTTLPDTFEVCVMNMQLDQNRDLIKSMTAQMLLPHDTLPLVFSKTYPGIELMMLEDGD